MIALLEALETNVNTEIIRDIIFFLKIKFLKCIFLFINL